MKIVQVLQSKFRIARFLMAIATLGIVLLGTAFPVLAMESPRDRPPSEVPQVERKSSNNPGIRNRTEVEEPQGGLFSRKQERVDKGKGYSNAEVNNKGARVRSQQTVEDQAEKVLEKVVGDR